MDVEEICCGNSLGFDLRFERAHFTQIPSVSLNSVVREVALDTSEGLYELNVVSHIRGVDNKLADSLSRLHDPNQNAHIPDTLLSIPRTVVEKRDRVWWRTVDDPDL